MKRVLQLLGTGIFLLLLSACKKDWQCVCVDPNGYENRTTLTQLSEKDARVACEILAVNDLSCALN